MAEPTSYTLVRPSLEISDRLTSANLPRTAPGKPGKELFVWMIARGVGRRWKQVIVFGFLAAAAVGSAFWFFLPPPVPSATAKLHIPQKPPTALGGEHPDPPVERQTQVALVRSRLVLNAAIRPPEINNLPILQAEDDKLDWLAAKLKVDFDGPEILRISMSNEDPEQARLLVDAVKDSYLQHIVNRSISERGDRLKRLNEMAVGQEESLKRKRTTISNLSKGSGGYNTERLAFQQRLFQDQMAAVRSQLVRVESELRGGRLREENLAADAPVIVSETVVDRYVDSDIRVQESAQKLKLQQDKHTALAKTSADPNAKFVIDEKVKEEEYQKEHAAIRERVRSEVRHQIQSQSKTDRTTKLLFQKQDDLILEQIAKQLRAEFEEYGKTLSNERILVEDLEPIRFEIKQAEELLSRIRGTIATLTMEQYTPPRVIELEKATITRADAVQRKARFAGGGALLAFLAATALIGLVELKHRRIDNPSGVSQGLGLRLVGTVPRISLRRFRWLGPDAEDAAEGCRSEAIACTRTMLLHGEGLSTNRVVLVTSPVSGEGKTFLSVQLAISIAQSGRRILLVDGDLRSPSIHEHLQMPAGPGLCEVLRSEASLFDVVQKTTIPNLLLISGGRWTPETAEALLTARLDQLFAIWRDEFEFVLLDSSPVLPVADALLLARHADGVILSVLQGVSRMPQAAEAAERFSSLGVEVMGVVVSGTTAKTYGESAKYYSATRVRPTPTSPVQA